MKAMQLSLLPKTKAGKWAAILGILFIIMISLKIAGFMPLMTFAIAAFGLAGFVASIIAIIKKDRAIIVFIAFLAGIVIILWIVGEVLL
jgi:hypothetical protein